MSNIVKFQNYLKKNNYDYFFINRTDEFLNEYIAPYAERLKWLTGFSGSAGRAIISKSSTLLFVDGRYTFQSKKEVNGKEVTIKHLNDYWQNVNKLTKLKVRIALDNRLHSINEIYKLENLFRKSQSSIVYLNDNPIDELWIKKPAYPNSKIFDHPLRFSGKSRNKKINNFQSYLRKKNINYYILSSLDSIAWLLNIRGNDIEHTPLAFAYLLIPNKGKLILFCSINKIEKNLFNQIKNLCILKKFKDIEEVFKGFSQSKLVGMDYNNTPNYFKDLSNKNGLLTRNLTNPIIVLKAIKNVIELRGAKKANIRDGVSIVKFIYWLKKIKDLSQVTELKVAKYLYKLRKKNKLFYSLSFDTISAVGHHSALPHYRVTKNTDIKLKKNNIYLVDSGGQYKDGTTDITRTIILGNSDEEKKDRFTRVLKGHIAIATHYFKFGTKGSDIDYLARKSLSEINCDYDHGTGHGIGSFLNVHEGPQRIAKKSEIKSEKIMKGMIISNEPGYYKENHYGIRIENLLTVKRKNLNKLQFETISFAPIDRDLINKNLLSHKEILWLNKYHSKVYRKIHPYLSSAEKLWLKQVTKAI
tara:strand:+ start:1039 stop:2793 length:1755 start_codon:yes stop_codon:yes gene_type:complete